MGKSSDRNTILVEGPGLATSITRFTHGYVPNNIGLGCDMDYIEFRYCADCGQMQGSWPLNINEAIAKRKKEY